MNFICWYDAVTTPWPPFLPLGGCMRGVKTVPESQKQAALPLPACVRASADGGATLAVHAKPGSKRAAVVAVADVVEVAIDAPAREGEANAALADFLADTLQVKRRQVVLCSGGKCRDKVFRIAELDPAELASRLRAALPQ